jgi:hypothetical protein
MTLKLRHSSSSLAITWFFFLFKSPYQLELVASTCIPSSFVLKSPDILMFGISKAHGEALQSISDVIAEIELALQPMQLSLMSRLNYVELRE